MADKYYRLVSFLVNICPLPLRQLFLKYMNADPCRPLTCSTLTAYLAFRKSDIYLLKSKKKIRQVQWDLLYPKFGQADETNWDITLTLLLIDELFGVRLQKVEDDAIQVIRRIRNFLQHMAETSMEDADFDQIWSELETATIDIAKQINPSPVYENTVKDHINDTKINNMPKLGDTLRYWYERIIMQLKSDLEEMKEILTEVSESTTNCVTNTSACKTILQQSSVGKVAPSGEKVKRIKTVDQILSNMNHAFIATLQSEASPQFGYPQEVHNIKSKLRDAHHVVVSGYRGSNYHEVALAAIRDMGYNHNRCVEMRTSSDWRHVDPEEVDLVLCVEPFGDFSYDEVKTKHMADNFNSMKRTAKPSDGIKHIDIIVVAELDILQRVRTEHEHDILEEVVKLYQPTTKNNPADLTGPLVDSGGVNNSITQNLLGFTAVFVDENKREILSSKAFSEAKEMLKKHKVVVLSGPKKCGKTTLALSLASGYPKEEFMIVKRPEDMRFVTLNKICLILVEDFGGKNRFDESTACTWLQEFEFIHSAVRIRKLNVIITCNETWLQKCQEQSLVHPILLHKVMLSSEERYVKVEVASTECCEDESRSQRSDSMITHRDSNSDTTEIHGEHIVMGQNTTFTSAVMKVQDMIFPGDDIDDDEDLKECPSCFCRHPDGSFLILSRLSSNISLRSEDYRILQYNSQLQYITQYEIELPHFFGDISISCTEAGDVVICIFNNILLYRISNGLCKCIESTKIPGYVQYCSVLSNTIYVSSDDKLYVLGRQLCFIEARFLFGYCNSDISDLAVCGGRSVFYVNENSIVCQKLKSKEMKLREYEGFEPMSLCAASDDSVFVLGRQSRDGSRLLQVNTELETISDIMLEEDLNSFIDMQNMVFDRTDARLILLCDRECYQIYLK